MMNFLVTKALVTWKLCNCDVILGNRLLFPPFSNPKGQDLYDLKVSSSLLVFQTILYGTAGPKSSHI